MSQIKTRPAAREVAATYTIQEFSMELVISLPVNHPLGVVTVESGRRVGIPSNQWRNWMLQMTTFLTHQVGIHDNQWYYTLPDPNSNHVTKYQIFHSLC